MLYIGNPSHQNAVFSYREPRTNLLQHLAIARGAQEVVGAGWTPDETTKVIEQLQRFGGRPSTEARRKLGRFSGFLYNDDRAITESELTSAQAEEMRTREQRSADAIINAAAGFDRVARKGRGRPSAKVTTTEVHQEHLGPDQPAGTGLDFSLTVDPEAQQRERPALQ